MELEKERLDNLGGVDMIYKLQNSPNYRVYEMANHFLSKYYSDDQDA